MSKIVLEPVVDLSQSLLDFAITENAKASANITQQWEDFQVSDVNLINTVYWEDL